MGLPADAKFIKGKVCGTENEATLIASKDGIEGRFKHKDSDYTLRRAGAKSSTATRKIPKDKQNRRGKHGEGRRGSNDSDDKRAGRHGKRDRPQDSDKDQKTRGRGKHGRNAETSP